MTYTYNNKTFNIPNEEIDKMMESLDISLAEACETYLFDHDWIIDPTAEELTVKAQKNRVTATIHDAKGEKKERKPREKKVNPLKKEIIEFLFDHLHGFLYDKNSKNFNINITNNEKYIDFSIEGRNFTINLVEHRPKKK